MSKAALTRLMAKKVMRASSGAAREKMRRCLRIVARSTASCMRNETRAKAAGACADEIVSGGWHKGP